MYQQRKDELRARFTAWLDEALRREAAHYCKVEKRQKIELSLEDIPPSKMPLVESAEIHRVSGPYFDFEEDILAEAFASLSPKRQKVLTMLFAEDRKPGEIARILGDKPENIYLLRYRSLKDLKRMLLKGGLHK